MRAASFPLILVLCAALAACGDDEGGTAADSIALHDGYWVTEIETPELPVPITVINDMHIDAATRRATVYAQANALGQVATPPQVGPGECTESPVGGTVCFHPNAVYLNGSGEALDAADGTGAWWVKHSWIVDGEGYYNCEFTAKEEYIDGQDCLWAEGVMLEDGVTMRVGGTGDEASFYNTRRPLLAEDPVTYEVVRFAPANTDPEAGPIDLTPTEQFVLLWDCVAEPSALDGRTRPCPEMAETSDGE